MKYVYRGYRNCSRTLVLTPSGEAAVRVFKLSRAAARRALTKA